MDTRPTVLIISAHPDDMEIGMGGTAAKLAASGARVVSMILTDGRRSPNTFDWTEDEMAEVRNREAHNAAAALGIGAPIFLNLPSLEGDQFHVAVAYIAMFLKDEKPTVAYTLHPQLDRHPTHRKAGEATLEAKGKAAWTGAVWAYEVWGAFPRPDQFEGIDGTVGEKALAIRAHQSQIATMDYGTVIGFNRWRAAFSDTHSASRDAAYAEAFMLLSREGV